MVTAITNSSGTKGLADAPATTVPGTRISEDFDAFLRLMTAQMRHQNPLEPLDGTQFVTQLAQFSGVEQQVQTNAKLDALLAALTGSAADAALGYLGRVVETASGLLQLEADQPASFAFETDTAANKAVAVVLDEAGNEVRRLPVEIPAPGRHQASWDGRNGAGEQAPPAVYQVRLLIYDDAGQQVVREIPALTRAKVMEARLGDDGTTLILSNGATTEPAELRAIAA
jgi:flagellar basal-body rod modification protein FlgD